MAATVASNEAEVNAEVATSEGEFAIDQCSSCGSQISLRSPTPQLPASALLCRRCGSVFFARCQEIDGQPIDAGTKSVSYYEVMKAINVHIEGRLSSISRNEVRRLARFLAAQPYRGPEVRKQKRYPITAPVTVVPLGADLRVSNQPARMMTINISGGGAALLHASRIVEPFLVIDFAAANVDLLPAILQVTRVRPLGSGYEVAGKFLSRIMR